MSARSATRHGRSHHHLDDLDRRVDGPESPLAWDGHVGGVRALAAPVLARTDHWSDGRSGAPRSDQVTAESTDADAAPDSLGGTRLSADPVIALDQPLPAAIGVTVFGDTAGTLTGGKGGDAVGGVGANGADKVAQDHALSGSGDDDALYGDAGTSLRGGAGGDGGGTFNVSNLYDSGTGGGGGSARGGDDTLSGGAGEDALYGDAGTALAGGAGGKPALPDSGGGRGGSAFGGSDLLDGGDGNDTLVGDSGGSVSGGTGAKERAATARVVPAATRSAARTISAAAMATMFSSAMRESTWLAEPAAVAVPTATRTKATTRAAALAVQHKAARIR